MSDDKKIEAWLAGKLSDEDAKALEASLDDTAPAEPADDDFLGLKAEPISKEVDLLIKHVRDEGGHTPPDVDGWRDILQPSDDPKLLGTLGHEPRYEISSVIAVGGMSIVFKGRDPKLNRTVAIKTLTPELTANRITHERFLREARSASRLEHDHIIPIYGVHDEDGVPFIAMKFVEGGTLQDVLDSKGEISIERQQSIARQMAMALEFAHGEGVIHRDIKPANILLDSDGERAWLCDFGVARSTEDPSLTYAGSVAGTPQYMAPEQASGEEYDHRCDLFSLGTVLYRCATGQPAFAGKTTHAVLKNLAETDARPARILNSNLPPWYDRLISNLIAKDPDDRFPDAGTVVRAINSQHTPRPRSKARRLRQIAAAAIALLLISITLQLPAFREAGSEVIASTFNRPFRIANHLGTHHSLKEAIDAASDGDTIYLPTGVDIAVDLLEIPAGKNLTLRAAPDASGRPVLTTADIGATGIISRSRLHLIGLDFQLRPKRESRGIVNLIDADATIEDCRFTGHHRPDVFAADKTSRVIELRGGGTLEVLDSMINIGHGDAIALSDPDPDPSTATPARVRIHRTQIAAFQACSLSSLRNDKRPVHIDFHDSRFSGHFFFKSFSRQSPQIHLHAERSVFETGRAFIRLQSNQVATVHQHFHFTGKENHHPLGKKWLTVGSAGQIISWDEPKPDIGVIQIAGTDQTFTDLTAACAAAEDGATLLLSGEISTEVRITTPPGRTLHFRAAPGASPTIIFIASLLDGIHLFGPSTFEDIAFLRRTATADTVALSMVYATGIGPFRFERCRFESTPAVWDRSSGVGLALLNAKEATVRHCTFLIPGGAAFSIDYAPHKASPLALFQKKIVATHLQIEDSLIAAPLTLYHRSTIGEVSTRLTATRSTFLCDRLLTEDPRPESYPIRFEISDSLIDVQKSYFEVPEVHLPALRETLKWDGSGNHYRPDTTIITATYWQLAQAEQPASIAGLKIANFFTDYPRASDPTATIVSLFDRARLTHPITPTALKALLPASVKSPAVKALQQLAEQ